METLMTRRAILAGGAATVIAGTSASGASTKAWVNSRAIPLSRVGEATQWLLSNFRGEMERATSGTPFSVELACAMACQESAYAWIDPNFRKGRSPSGVLRLIVLDASDKRGAFPRNEKEFRRHPTLGKITDELIAVADEARDARGVTKKRGTLMYGYGLFQYDLQNSLTDPEFWLSPAPGSSAASRQHGLWGSIDACVDRWRKEMDGKYKAARGDLWEAVKRYNGSGSDADLYKQFVFDNFTEIRRLKIV
ncbi:hypothetical protein [Sphingomonas sp. IC4-52]|uniref:hypothetical protein n=1 Tax=Sphingomonas sp. IC4-52 TaxID=2887202 RepID=UPI001D0F8190|nr:hypothetical protein [Sphingomonas sp. IC4-52]MCC2978889.1 hypothetical protein [Sphingomonas sp. IC4-52]